MAGDAAISASADVIIRIRVRVGLLFSSCRMVLPPLQRLTHIQVRVGPGSALFSLPSDGAEYRSRRNKRNDGSEPEARQFNSFADRQRRHRVGADKADPQEVNDRGRDERDEKTIAARGRNA